MKKLLLLFTLMSCEIKPKIVQRREHVCTCEQLKMAAQFVKDGIKPSNNMSDEEMEDVIRQLEDTAIRLHCPTKTIDYYENNLHKPLNLDSCENIM